MQRSSGGDYQSLKLGITTLPPTTTNASTGNPYNYVDDDDDPYANPDEFKRKTYSTIREVSVSISMAEEAGTDTASLAALRPALPPLRQIRDVAEDEKKSKKEFGFFLEKKGEFLCNI